MHQRELSRQYRARAPTGRAILRNMIEICMHDEAPRHLRLCTPTRRVYVLNEITTTRGRVCRLLVAIRKYQRRGGAGSGMLVGPYVSYERVRTIDTKLTGS